MRSWLLLLLRIGDLCLLTAVVILLGSFSLTRHQPIVTWLIYLAWLLLADLAIVDGVVDAIKLKTDQLTFTVSNQVDSNALTGGGGDDAATIYSYFTASNREDQFKSDVSGLATSSDLATVDSNVDSIKAITDQMVFTVSGQIDANALTGGGGDDAATIYSYFTASNREDQFKSDVSGLASQSSVNIVDSNVDSIKAKTDQLAFSVSNQVDANAFDRRRDSNRVWCYLSHGNCQRRRKSC